MFSFLLFTFLIFTQSYALCPEGCFEWQTSCFCFQTNSSGFAFSEANCVKSGGHLVSIHDGFTNALLAQEAADHFFESTITDFWIGLTDLMVGGNWTWMDGTKLDFVEWAPGEPQNTTGNNCASLSLNNGLWKTDDCFKSKPYICQTVKTEPSTTPKYPIYANCTQPFIYFEPTHSCYGLANWTSIMNWTLGQEYCESIKGNLVSVHSYEEKYFMMSLVLIANNNIWTGGYSNDGGNTWKWSDSSPWDFDPWQSTFPNSHTSACVGVGIGGLWDEPCSNQMRYVCKIKL